MYSLVPFFPFAAVQKTDLPSNCNTSVSCKNWYIHKVILQINDNSHYYNENTLSLVQHLHNIRKIDGCIVLNEHNTVFASKRSAICNRCFPRPTRVLDANGISIASAVFAGLTRWQTNTTDRPTDHATRSVATGGAHSGEAKFCYCLWLQQVFIGAVDSNTPCLPFLRSRSPDGATH